MNLQPASSKPSSLRLPEDSRDRRLHRRVQWSVNARGLNAEGQEFAARTIDLCAGGIRLFADIGLSAGEKVVLYLDDIGRVEATVVRVLAQTEFAVAIKAPPRKREKIADQLTWLINREALSLIEERVAERRPGSEQVVVTFGEGMRIACSVIDMSLFGVALRTNGPRPQLGVTVTVADRTGTCVRFFEGGFAVDFRNQRTDDATN